MHVDRARVGIVVVLLGLLLAGWLAEGNPPPTRVERWLDTNHSHGFHLAARGPAEMRYDAARDVTYAVFQCDHAYCDVALTLEGDQRRLSSEPSLILLSRYSPARASTEPLEPPIIAASWQGEQVVSLTTAEVFPVTPRAPLVAMQTLPFLAVALGLVAAWRVSREELGAAALGAAAGVAMGLRVATAGPELGGVPDIAAWGGVLGAVGLAVLGRRWAPARAFAWGVLLFGVATAYLGPHLAPFFPTPPRE